jgi:nitrogen fixation protein
MKVTIRKMGNSQDVLIPKPILAQLGLIVLDQYALWTGRAWSSGWARCVRRPWP